MNWRCYLGHEFPVLERWFWPLFGHLVRFRGRGEVYCERCTWTDLY